MCVVNMFKNLIRTKAKLLFLCLVLACGLFGGKIDVSAASVSKELGADTTFLIQEYLELYDREIILTIYDRETGYPISYIKVELYYEDSDVAITGSEGQYITDENGEIIFKLSGYTINGNYHFEINAPGYYPYIGEDFILNGDMNLVIYLDPLPVAPEIPDVEEPEIEDPETEDPDTKPEEEKPESEEDQEEIPNDDVKTGDDTSVIVYMSLAVLALLGMLIYFLYVKSKDEEDEE